MVRGRGEPSRVLLLTYYMSSGPPLYCNPGQPDSRRRTRPSAGSPSVLSGFLAGRSVPRKPRSGLGSRRPSTATPVIIKSTRWWDSLRLLLTRKSNQVSACVQGSACLSRPARAKSLGFEGNKVPALHVGTHTGVRIMNACLLTIHGGASSPYTAVLP